MNEYTASNGVRLYADAGRLELEGAGVILGAERVDALREFFRAEEDERRGRWRWPDNPDYVVYAWTADPPRNDKRGVTVLSEAIPRSYTVWEDNVDTLYGTSENEEARILARKAARAYFDAHPEPKPEWYDAQHNEIWELSTPAMGARAYQVVRNEESGFRFFLISDEEGFRPGLFPEESQITAGRRIWPES